LRKAEVQPKNKTAEKLLSNEHIFGFLSQPCCSFNCASYWSVHEIKSYLRKMANLKIEEKCAKVTDLLKLMITKEEEKGSHVINGSKFNLILSGKNVCPQTFVFLHGIGYNKCTQLVNDVVNNHQELLDQEEEELSINIPDFDNYDEPIIHRLNSEGEISSFSSKSRVQLFLKFLFQSEHFSEPMMGFPESHRRVSLFPTKNSVYQFYGTGEFNGIFGDFPEWVQELKKNPVSEKYFVKIWKDYFPNLFTESDKPQCCFCQQNDEKRKEFFKNKDFAKVNELVAEKKEHLFNAKSLFSFQKSQQLLSKLYANKSSFVIDNASSKSIPKYRKEKSDAWSKDKLTVHIGGTFEDETDSVYYLHPEIISESSNTILTQIHFTLLRLSQRSSQFEEITFIFDNHSTQFKKITSLFLTYIT